MPAYGLNETHFEKDQKMTVAQAIAQGHVTLEKTTTETIGPDGARTTVVKYRAVFKHNGLELAHDAYEQGLLILQERISKLPPPTPNRKSQIKAVASSDDEEVRIRFDATSWFEEATDEEIRKLAAIGWGGDYEADHVADHYEDSTTSPLFEHLEEVNKGRPSHELVGFECRIDEKDALRWLKKNRPHLHAVLRNRK